MASTAVMHSAGLQFILNQLKASTIPANYYVGIRTLDGTGGHTADAAAADTLSSNLNEVSTSGTGYARQSFAASALTVSASGANYLITAPAKAFSFTGAVTGATHAFLATTADNSGVMLFSAPLAALRNYANGDTETITISVLGEQGP